jgi:uncharacterized protein (DUF2336 family)
MIGFVKKLLGFDRRAYDRQKKILAAGQPQQLEKLAAQADTNPEILYFLAAKGNDAARLATAQNVSTPLQAVEFQARDKSVDVRLALADRLTKLLPDLSAEKHAQLYAFAVSALKTLAEDEVVQVRKALSSALKDYAKAPPAVVTRLAKDVEREVAEPILTGCAALPDDALLDILAQHPSGWVVEAVAQRKNLSSQVTEAVFAKNDEAASALLLANTGASFSQDLLQNIIEQARMKNEWHMPIALRPELTLSLTQRFIGFVDQAILKVLEQRRDFDPAQRDGIRSLVQRRLIYIKSADATETAEQKVLRLAKENALTTDIVEDAMAWLEKDVAIAALAVLARIDLATTKKMLDSGSARAVAALCQRAGISMRVCVEAQRNIAKIPHKDILYARGGTEYPLDPADIKWQLEFFGVKTS